VVLGLSAARSLADAKQAFLGGSGVSEKEVRDMAPVL
jgi:hypothetical protein